MTKQELYKAGICDKTKDSILRMANNLFNEHGTPLEDGIRIMFNSYMKPACDRLLV